MYIGIFLSMNIRSYSNNNYNSVMKSVSSGQLNRQLEGLNHNKTAGPDGVSSGVDGCLVPVLK